MNYRKYNKRSSSRKYAAVGAWFLLLIFVLALIGYGKRTTNSKPVVLPVAHASDTEIIKCELGVPEYLQCLVVRGVISSRDAEILTAISKAESGHRANAKNRRSTASGAFQIVAGTWYAYDCVGDKWNFKDNTNCAVKIYKRSGTSPWNASKSVWIKNI